MLFRDVPYSYGYTLDEYRRVDYGENRRPMGVELLDVSLGVDLQGLPDAEPIAAELVATISLSPSDRRSAVTPIEVPCALSR